VAGLALLQTTAELTMDMFQAHTGIVIVPFILTAFLQYFDVGIAIPDWFSQYQYSGFRNLGILGSW